MRNPFGAVLAAALAAGTAFAAPPPRQATVHSIDRSIDPTALCNDGTTPKYWYRPGVGQGASHWVIWLEGGGECIDQPSCAARATDSSTAPFVTSNGFMAGQGFGLLSSRPGINPALYDANAVLLHYCSSDAWSGRKLATAKHFNPNDPSSWNFVGKRIALAAVKSLIEAQPELAAAKQILIGGSSAGGEGMTTSANDLVPLLPASAQILFANDAGFALNIGQFDPAAAKPYIYGGSPNAFDIEFMKRLSFWNAGGDAQCDASAQTQAQLAQCLQSGYLLQNNYIRLPSLITESALDTAQILLELCPAQHGMCQISTNPASKPGIYAAAFAARMAPAVGNTSTQSGFTGFVPQQYVHELLVCDQAFAAEMPFPGGKLSARDALTAWLADPTAPMVLHVGTGPGVRGRPIACNNK